MNNRSLEISELEAEAARINKLLVELRKLQPVRYPENTITDSNKKVSSVVQLRIPEHIASEIVTIGVRMRLDSEFTNSTDFKQWALNPEIIKYTLAEEYESHVDEIIQNAKKLVAG